MFTHCQAPDCNKPVPPGRTKYCSVRCCGIVNRRNARERERAAKHSKPGAIHPAHQVAQRVCLACGRKFRSEGPHNRICAECRASDEIDYRPAHATGRSRSSTHDTGIDTGGGHSPPSAGP